MNSDVAAGGRTADGPKRLGSEKAAVLYSGAIITSSAAALGFLGIYLLRGGLGDSLESVGAMLAFCLLPVWLSAWAISYFGSTPLIVAMATMISLFTGVLFPLLGLAQALPVKIGCCALLFAGLLAAVPRLRNSFLAVGLRGLILVPFFAILLALLTAPWRFFLPEAQTLGIATTDSYFHAAIAQMILNYRKISTGADGFGLVHYHILSHSVAAGLARTSSAGVPLVYLYWGALTLKVQFIWCFFCSGLLLFETDRLKCDVASPARLVYAWLPLIFIPGSESESFMLSAVLFLAALPLMIALMDADLRDRGAVAGTVALCVALFFLAAAKTSAGFFGAISLVCVTLTFRRAPLLVCANAATLIILALFTYFWIMPRDLTMSGSPLLAVARNYLYYISWLTFASYALPVVVIGIFVLRPRASIGKSSLTFEFHPLWHERVDLSLRAAGETKFHRILRLFFIADGATQFMILSFLSCVVILFTMPIGDNMSYFSYILYIAGFQLLPVALVTTLNICLANPWNMAFILFLVITNMPVARFTDEFTSTIISLYSAVYPKGEKPHVKDLTVASWKMTHTPFAILRERVLLHPWAHLMKELQTQQLAANGKLAVQIQPQAQEVWRRLQSNSAWWCMAPQLMVPAEAGIAEIRSIIPKDLEQKCTIPGMVYYGFGKEQDLHRAGVFSSAELCALAEQQGARRVYRLMSYTDLSKNTVVLCTSLNSVKSH